MNMYVRGTASILLLALSARPMMSQDSAKRSIVLAGVGLTIPQGDFADGAKSALHVQLGHRLLLGESVFGIRSDVMYTKGDIKAELPAGASASWSIATLAVGVQAEARSGTVRPYAFGQWALYDFAGKASYQGVSMNDSIKKGGISLGGGVQFAVGGLHLYAEARYGSATGDGDTLKFLPLTIGLTF